MNAYTIRLPLFEGPPDLLLYLVEKRELQPVDVSVAEVAAQCRAQLSSPEKIDLDAASEVLVTVARLLSIKARALLPGEQAGDAEPEPGAGEDDPPEVLRSLERTSRLVQAQARVLAELAAEQSLRFRRPPYAALAGGVPAPGWTPGDEELAPAELAEAFSRVWTRHRRRARVIPGQLVNIRRRMAEVLKVLRTGGAAFFSALCRQAWSRGEVVVTFLALLELVRRRKITLTQAEPFADLAIGIRGRSGAAGRGGVHR